MPQASLNLMDRVQTPDGRQGVVTVLIDTWPQDAVVALDVPEGAPPVTLRTSVENLMRVRKVEAVR